MFRAIVVLMTASLAFSACCKRGQGKEDEVVASNSASTSASMSFEEDPAHAVVEVLSLEEKGAPAGTDRIAGLMRAQHPTGRPTEEELRALPDVAGTLLAIEENAQTMGERVQAIRAMRVTTDPRVRGRLLDLLGGENLHVAIREAAALGLRGFDMTQDSEVREALEQAAQSPEERVASAARQALGR